MSHTQNQNRSGANNQRRRNRNSNSNRRPSGTGHSGPGSYGSTGKSPAPKKTLMQKLLGLVGLGGKKKAASRTTATSTQTNREQATNKVTRTSTSNPRQSRKPENVEVTNPRLYIGNLSYDATEGDLQEVFNGVGRVTSIEIVTNSRTQRSKGYGFVEMGSIEEAKRAVETLHDKEFMNRKMVVSGAKPKDESGSRE